MTNLESRWEDRSSWALEQAYKIPRPLSLSADFDPAEDAKVMEAVWHRWLYLVTGLENISIIPIDPEPNMDEPLVTKFEDPVEYAVYFPYTSDQTLRQRLRYKAGKIIWQMEGSPPAPELP